MIKVLEIDTISIKQKFFRSPWLFSNQVQHLQDKDLNNEKIALVNIKNTKKIGIYSKRHLISIRFLPDRLFPLIENGFIKKDTFINEIAKHISSLKKDKLNFSFTEKEAYRLSHGDNDCLPAIAIEDYHSTLVIQSSAAVGDFLLPFVIEALSKIESRPIFERSTGQVRKLEELPERTRWIREQADLTNQFEVNCNFANLKMSFFLNKAQKTGLFIDQRNNLKYLMSILEGYKLNSCLDICSYAGAWSSAAAKSGVTNFTLIDQDSWALNLARKNITENTQNNVTISTLHGDLFEHMQGLIKKEKKFDLVVADPPAFAKNKKHINEAKRAYSRMAKLASRLLNKNGILVICSCSRHIKDQEFLESISLGLEEGNWLILHKGEQSPCHTHLATPDSSEYLKCYFIYNRSLS